MIPKNILKWNLGKDYPAITPGFRTNLLLGRPYEAFVAFHLAQNGIRFRLAAETDKATRKERGEEPDILVPDFDWWIEVKSLGCRLPKTGKIEVDSVKSVNSRSDHRVTYVVVSKVTWEAIVCKGKPDPEWTQQVKHGKPYWTAPRSCFHPLSALVDHLKARSN